MELLNNSKNKNLVRVMRFVLLLTFIYRGFLIADGTYNGNLAIGFGTGSTAIYVAILLGSGLVTGMIAWLATSLTFSIISRSAFAPIRTDGVAAITYCSYHFNAYAAMSLGNIIIGSLSFIAFYNNILSALIIYVISKIITIFTIILFDILIGHKFKGKEVKQFITAVTFPNIILMLLF